MDNRIQFLKLMLPLLRKAVEMIMWAGVAGLLLLAVILRDSDSFWCVFWAFSLAVAWWARTPDGGF